MVYIGRLELTQNAKTLFRLEWYGNQPDRNERCLNTSVLKSVLSFSRGFDLDTVKTDPFIYFLSLGFLRCLCCSYCLSGKNL